MKDKLKKIVTKIGSKIAELLVIDKPKK